MAIEREDEEIVANCFYGELRQTYTEWRAIDGPRTLARATTLCGLWKKMRERTRNAPPI